MNEILSPTLERLARHGVIDTTAQQPFQNTALQKEQLQTITPDVFESQKIEKTNKLKTIGACALITYLTGVALTKGKLNPIEGLSAILSTFGKALSKFINLFKKSWK